ncbi:transcriptional regulator, TetR family [Bradyrhizobiaceae bacterium SG-6C]|nr:transcriptional regulator, TetR family [Bradyrhizobiaceae bacterium SG-6C]
MTLNAVARPRRGAPRKSDATARERIMSVAADLFYREGIRATGVDRIVEVSGVSKTSLYRSFESKDELITAYAEAHDRKFWDKWVDVAEAHKGQPLQQLDAFMDSVADSINRPAYRGCPFINLAIELPDENHPARIVAAATKARLTDELAQIAASLSAADPARVAHQISMLINGAFASGSIAKGSVSGRDLKDAVAAIIHADRPARHRLS